MKRIIAMLLTLMLATSLVSIDALAATKNQNASKKESEKSIADKDSAEDPETEAFSFDVDLEGIESIDDLESRIDKYMTSAIDSLNTRWSKLSKEIDTYKNYRDNAEKVSEFYQTVVSETNEMCIMLKEYSAVYARMILDSDMTSQKKYRAVDEIHDVIYNDACDEINDEIYDGLLDDMYEYIYEGILDEQPKNVDYSEWYDACSDEYSQWYDACSDVYKLYYNTASDIYSFYYDMSSELYSDDLERAEKVYEKFVSKIAKDKGFGAKISATDAEFDPELRDADNIDELESVVEDHVTECVQALKNEWGELSTRIDTFEKYQDNADTIEDFHTHITDSAAQILVMIREYGVSYTELILNTNSIPKDKYRDFEGFSDSIYDDACDIVKDEIYDDLLEEMKDYYYDGIIKDAKDSVPYKEWSDARSDAYSWWSDARSDVYSDWSDARSDLYRFYSDMRSELYGGDLDGANDKLDRLVKKIDKLK